MTTSCQSTYHVAAQSPFRRALQSDLDAAFAAAFARLRRAACKLARRQERGPRTGKIVGPVAELCRLAIAAGGVADVCNDWLPFAPFGIGPPVEQGQMGERDFRLTMGALAFVKVTRDVRDGRAMYATGAINKMHDELIEAALAVGCER